MEFGSKGVQGEGKDFRHSVEVIPVICPNGCVICNNRVLAPQLQSLGQLLQQTQR